MLCGYLVDAFPACERAAELARELQDREGISDSQFILLNLHWHGGRFEQAIAAADAAAAHGENDMSLGMDRWSVSSMNPLFDDSSRPSTAASVRMRPMVEPVGPGVNSAGLTDEEQAAKREALRLELAKKMKEELNAKRMGTVQAWGEPAEQQV